MWVRRTRLTLVVALLLSLAILAWIAAHPKIYAGHIGRVITRNLLSDLGLSFSYRDLAGNPLSALRFYDVIVTHDGGGSGFAYLSCDSLDIAYDLNALMERRVVLHDLTFHNPRLALRRSAGQPAQGARARSNRATAWELEIERLRLRNGELDLQGVSDQSHSFRSCELEAAVQVRAGTTRLRLDELSTRWPDGAYRQIHLRADLELRDSKLQVQDFVAELDTLQLRGEGAADFSGKGRPTWDARVAATGFDLDPLMTLLGRETRLALSADGAVELRGGEQFELEGNAVGTLRHYPFNLDHFVVRIHGDGMEIDTADGEVQGAQVSLGGSLDTHNKFLRLAGEISQFDLSREWKEGETSWPKSQIEADVSLDLDLEGEQELRLSVRDGAGTLHDIPVDSLRTELRIAPAIGLDIRSARLLTRGTTLRVAGTIDTVGVAELRLQARMPDAEPWLRSGWSQWQLFGLQARGRLHGPLRAPQLAMEGNAVRASGPQWQGEELAFDLEFSGLDRPENVGGRLSCERLSLRELPPGRAELRFRRRGDQVELPGFSLARGDSVLQLAGRADLHPGYVELALDSLALELGEVAWHLDGPSRLRVGGRRLGSEHFRLAGARGSLLLQGDADLDRDFDLTVQLHDMDLSLLRWAGLSPFDCAGVLNGSLELEGNSQAPIARLEFELRDGQWRQVRADRLSADLLAEGSSLRLNSVELNDRRGRLRAGGRVEFQNAHWLAELLREHEAFLDQWPGARIEATIAAQDVELDRWLPANLVAADRSWGELRTRLDLYGTARQPGIVGDITVQGLRTSAVHVPQLDARLESDAGGLHLRNGLVSTDHPWVEFEGEWPLVLSAAERPRLLEGGGLQLRVSSQGDVDLAPLQSLLPSLSTVEGSGRFTLLASGDPRQPQLRGEISLQASKLRLRDVSEEFRDVRVQGLFQDHTLELTRVYGRQGERGELEATGSVRFDGLKPDDLQASIQANRLLLISVPELRAIVSSVGPLQLRLIRPVANGPRVPHLSGQLRIDRARYTGEFTGGAGGDASLLTATSTPDWMADLQIALREQIRISNSVAELLVNGDIDLQRDLSGLRLRGVAEVATGRVSVARLLDFEITEGRLDFSRGTNLEPAVEIRAETDVPVYAQDGVGRDLEHVTVRVSGTFAEPILAFESESGYDEKTIINLLAGIPVDSGAEQAQFQALALRVAGKELTGALADRIEGIDTIELQPAEPGDESNQPRIGLGKYIDLADKPLYLRYTQGFSISERDVYLEYQLRRRFLLTFEVRRRLRESVAHTELNADLKFRVEY